MAVKFLIYTVILILYVVKPTIALLCFPIAYILISRKQRIGKAFISGIILSLPLSFINIFGGSYDNFPLSWYNLFCIAYILYESFNKLKFSYHSGTLIIVALLGVFALSTILSYDPSISIKSLLTTGVTCVVLLFFLCNYYLEKYSNEDLQMYRTQYIVALCSIGVSMLTLKVLFLFGIEFSNSGIMDVGGGRIGNRFLFTDFSFLSIFLSTGVAYCLFIKFENKWIQTIICLLLLWACIETTARSGLVALLIFVFLFFVKKFLSTQKVKYLIIIAPFLFISVIAVNVLNNRRNSKQAITDGSGRIENIINSMVAIKENPFFGVGPGAKVYRNYIENEHGVVDNYEIPHNIIFQMLVYYGMVGLIILSLFFIYLIINRKDTPEYNMFYVCVIGAFFVPDIFVSRFFLVMILLMWMSRTCDSGIFTFKVTKKIK